VLQITAGIIIAATVILLLVRFFAPQNVLISPRPSIVNPSTNFIMIAFWIPLHIIVFYTFGRCLVYLPSGVTHKELINLATTLSAAFYLLSLVAFIIAMDFIRQATRPQFDAGSATKVVIWSSVALMAVMIRPIYEWSRASKQASSGIYMPVDHGSGPFLVVRSLSHGLAIFSLFKAVYHSIDAEPVQEEILECQKTAKHDKEGNAIKIPEIEKQSLAEKDAHILNMPAPSYKQLQNGIEQRPNTVSTRAS
jgi:hypothetical protein